MGCTGKGESEGWKWNDGGFLSGEGAIECGRWGVYRRWQIKIQFGLEGVTESPSQGRWKRVGGKNPVSPTITAIILMWPTIPTAYRFSMTMESHISLSSPRAFQVTVCISWERETSHFIWACLQYMCVQILKPACVPTSAEAGTLYVILYLRGDLCINTVIINRVLLFPGGAKTANTSPPWPSTPVIRPHSKHNVSSGSFDADCLHIDMRGRCRNRNIETKKEGGDTVR